MNETNKETLSVSEFLFAYDPVYEQMIADAIGFIEQSETDPDVTEGAISDSYGAARLRIADALKEKFEKLSNHFPKHKLDEFRVNMYAFALQRVDWDEVAENFFEAAKARMESGTSN